VVPERHRELVQLIGTRFFNVGLGRLKHHDEGLVSLDRTQPEWAAHCAAVRHHMEHHPHGIDDLTLLDLSEILIDEVAYAIGEGRDVQIPFQGRLHTLLQQTYGLSGEYLTHDLTRPPRET